MKDLVLSWTNSASPAILALALLVAAAAFSLLARRKPAAALPGPPPLGPLANTLEVLENLPRFLDWFLECSRKYGNESGQGTWAFGVLLQPRMTVTNDPENLKHVLGNVDLYGKGPVWRKNFMPILGNGIFSSDHKVWFHQRKRASHMFKVSNFKTSVLWAVKGKLRKLLGLLKERATEKGTGEATLDIQEYFFRLTLDTIGEIAFGCDLESLSGKNKDFMESFDFCQEYGNDLFFKPGHCWLWNTFTPRGWRFRRHAAVLKSYGNRLINRVLVERFGANGTHDTTNKNKGSQDGEGEGEGRETILTFFLNEVTPEALKDPATVRYLRDIIMNFNIAGRDTVAQAYSWAVWLLCQHPDVQTRMREEARRVLGPALYGEEGMDGITYDMVQALDYTHAVITETLRLYPSVPKEGKWAFADNHLPDGTFVPKDSWLLFLPYVMGRLESLWGPTAAVFDPSRHLTGPKPSSFVFTAFQAGPRICLGQRMAYMQLQLGLALLVLTFDLELQDPEKQRTPHPVQNTATLPMRSGLPVRLKLRSTP